MEYVTGIPITRYCYKHKLTTRERLEVFVHVCEGVQHAGIGVMAIPRRARRGKPRIQAKEEPTGSRASARRYEKTPPQPEPFLAGRLSCLPRSGEVRYRRLIVEEVVASDAELNLMRGR
jgi:hypothetical protein